MIGIVGFGRFGRLMARYLAEDFKVAVYDSGSKAAEIEKQTRKVEADTVRILSKADADATLMVDGEKASGLQLKAASFNDTRAFPLWEFSNKLNPDVNINILHTGEGTLWTDLKGAGMAELGGAKALKKPPAEK